MRGTEEPEQSNSGGKRGRWEDSQEEVSKQAMEAESGRRAEQWCKMLTQARWKRTSRPSNLPGAPLVGGAKASLAWAQGRLGEGDAGNTALFSSSPIDAAVQS